MSDTEEPVEQFELVERRETFEAFVRRAMPELLRFGTATGSPHDAEDLAQGALEAMAARLG